MTCGVMRRMRFAGVGRSIRVCGSCLKSGELTQAGKAADAGGLGLAETADHQGGVSVGDGDIGGELLAVEDGDIVDRAAGERFDLQVEVHFDGAGLLNLGVAFKVRPRSSY